jgi:hypothetical protein
LEIARLLYFTSGFGSFYLPKILLCRNPIMRNIELRFIQTIINKWKTVIEIFIHSTIAAS